MNFKLSTIDRSMKSGFTLVELLIVIALLGAIATIVIAAINPIEQANKARDAKYTADASQMISAIERYYASNTVFPWQTVAPTIYSSADTAFSLVNASNVNVGLCGTSCTSGTLGPLVTSDELKNEFLSRDFVTNTTTDITKKLWIGKGSGSSSSVYACFTPLAKATRDTAQTNGKVVDFGSGFSSTTGVPTYSTTLCTTAAATGWKDGSCVICIPQ